MQASQKRFLRIRSLSLEQQGDQRNQHSLLFVLVIIDVEVAHLVGGLGRSDDAQEIPQLL